MENDKPTSKTVSQEPKNPEAGTQTGKVPIPEEALALLAATQPPTNKNSKMRSLVVGMIGLLVVLLIVSLIATHYTKKTTPKNSSNTTSTLEPAQVDVTKTGFTPASIIIQKNQAVEWINQDTQPHQVNSDPYPTDNALKTFNEPETLNQNGTWDYVFSSSGTYTYHDNLNPYKYKGVVIVK
jgi:plastocyanin